MSWKKVRLGDICVIERGGSPRPIEKYITDSQNGINWIKIGDTSDSMFITSTAQKITQEGMKKSRYVQPGDFLLSNSMSFGRPYILDIDGCIHDGWLVLRDTNNQFDKHFLYYYLSAPTTFELFKSMAVGGVVNNLNSEMVRGLFVPLPSIQEQRNIAAVLDKISDLIALRKQQLAKLDELVKARFAEMFGDMLINPRDLPEQRLDSFSDIVSGITKGRKVKTDKLYEVPYMAVSNVKDGYIDWTTVKTIMATSEEINQYRLMPGDVLMTEGGDPDKLGRGAVIYEPPQDCIHQNHIFRVRLNQDILLSVFMVQYLQQQKAKRYFLGCAKQTTGIASINMKQLSALPVLVPPMKEQKEYASFVTHVDKSKVAILRAFGEAQLLFDSLMQKYFG